MSESKEGEFAPMAIAILVICFLVGMTGKFAFENFPNLVSPLTHEFGFARGTVASIYSMGGIVTGLSGPVVGTLFDRLGPRNVYGLGIFAGGMGLILAGFSNNILHFYFSISLLIGFTAAACGNVTNSALASRWFRKKLPLALAIIYSSMGVGSFLGLSVSQLLIETFGWRHAEFILGGCVLAMIPPLMLMPWRRLAAGRKEPFSNPSIDAPEPPEVNWTVGKAIRTPAFWGLASVFFFTGNAMFSVVIQAVTYLIEVGFTPVQASVNFGLTGILIPVGMVASGFLALRFGLFATAMLSYVLTLTAVLSLWSLDRSDHYLPLYGFILCFGLSMGSRGPMIGSIASILFRGRRFGTIYGFITVGGGLGMACGSFVSGLLYDFTGSYSVVFTYSCICLLLGASPFFLVREIRKQT